MPPVLVFVCVNVESTKWIRGNLLSALITRCVRVACQVENDTYCSSSLGLFGSLATFRIMSDYSHVLFRSTQSNNIQVDG